MRANVADGLVDHRQLFRLTHCVHMESYGVVGAALPIQQCRGQFFVSIPVIVQQPHRYRVIDSLRYFLINCRAVLPRQIGVVIGILDQSWGYQSALIPQLLSDAALLDQIGMTSVL